jgi:hypothetical protein
MKFIVNCFQPPIEWFFVCSLNPMMSAYLDLIEKQIVKNNVTIKLFHSGFEKLKSLTKQIIQIIKSGTKSVFDATLFYNYFVKNDISISIFLKITSDGQTAIREEKIYFLLDRKKITKEITFTSYEMLNICYYLSKPK